MGMHSSENMRLRRQMICLALIILLVILSIAGWGVLCRSFGRFSGDFLYPYLVTSRYAVDSLSDQTLLLFSRRELAAQLEALRNDNRRLASQAASAAELLVENDSLRRMMKLSPPPSWQYINGEIVLRDPRSWNERVSIDRGSIHGVKSGAAVMTSTPDGRLIFVGVVDKVNRRSSEVITVYNRALRMSAYMPMSGTVGVINADNAPRAGGSVGIGFLPVGSNYTVDEMLLTSGFERQIPAGIRIGNLSSINRSDSVFSGDLYLHGTLTPSAQISNIRFVVVADRVEPLREETE